MLACACQPVLNRTSTVGSLHFTMGADPNVVEIYERHFDFVWRSLRRLGVNSVDLEDAAQDVFIVVHRRLADFEQRSTIKSWIFGIALRVAKAYRHKAAKQRARFSEHDAVLVCTRDSPEQARAHMQAAEQVQLLLEALDDDKRAVFILAELEQLPAAEISLALGVPINRVHSRRRLARAAFEAGWRRLKAKDAWRVR